MDRFWWRLRWAWLRFVLLGSVIIGAILSGIVLAVTLFNTGVDLTSGQSWKALFTIAAFWFKIAWVLGLLLALILSFKKLFNRDFAGHRVYLLDCEKEILDPVILTDTLPLWRKFLLWMVWILSVVVLVLLGVLGMDKSYLGGPTLFAAIIAIGIFLLKPLLLSMKNVRIR